MTNTVLISTEDNATDKVILEIQRPVLTITTGIQGPTGPTGSQGSAGTSSNISAIAIKSDNYTLSINDAVVVFNATATALLPAATGSGRTYRLVCRSGILTVDADTSETIKGSTTAVLSVGEDLIITDIATGVWE